VSETDPLGFPGIASSGAGGAVRGPVNRLDMPLAAAWAIYIESVKGVGGGLP